MSRAGKGLKFVAAGALWALVALNAEAATTVRTIQVAGTGHLTSIAPGRDGLQSPEFAPTFANLPGLQDGPDASGSSAAASADAALKQARKRMVNRSIARSRGIGEAIA